ncbi:sialate O-acetylesterase [Dyadobacter bucti]|uniref:sialate O-acetylesterase n=1 Tax=Dyadobacter bucti TaxID=2572203 RepID=UPI003F70B271
MKHTTLFLLLMIASTTVFADNIRITWPADYAVFQRNTTSTGGATNVTFAGQFYNGTVTSYKIEKLNAVGGSLGDWKPYQALPVGSLSTLGTSISKYFYFTLSVPTGWYRFYVKDGAGGEKVVKFGVGEVFIIAGQSNAQGAGNIMKVSELPDYDCVVSNKNYIGSDLTKYKYLEPPVFGALGSANPSIGPRGDRPWFYEALGQQISTREAGQVIPVSFINVAHGGSSIDNWYNSMQRTRTMFNNNYSNAMVSGNTATQQNPYIFSGYDNRFPYIDLKNAVSFYGNMFGVRSVIWHQGEAETKTLLSVHLSNIFGAGPIPAGYGLGNYDTKLNAIIADTRTILPNLPWTVSKVSLHAMTRSPGTIVDYNIVNNSGNNLYVPAGASPAITVGVGGMITQEQSNVLATSNVSWASPSSDAYTFSTDEQFNNRSDGTHFNENGLKKVKEDINANMSSILSKFPVLPAAPPRMQLSQLGAQHHKLSTGNYSYYRWGSSSPNGSFDQTDLNLGNNWNDTNGFPDSGYFGFTKDANGRIYAVHPTILLPLISGALKGSEPDSHNNAYPNPVVDSDELKIFIKLDHPSPVHLQLADEKGAVLDQIDLEELDPGSHEFRFQLGKLEITKRMSFIIYHLKTNQHDESKKVLLVK